MANSSALEVKLELAENCEVGIVDPEEVYDLKDDQGLKGASLAKEIVMAKEEGDFENESTEGKDYVELNMVNYALVRCNNEEISEGSQEYELITTDHMERCEAAPDETLYLVEECASEKQEPCMAVLTRIKRDSDTLVVMQYPESEQPGDNAFVAPQDTDTDIEPSLFAEVIHNDIPVKKKRRKTSLPPLHELLASPNLRLFLYSCRQCSFKCNAIKDLRDHKNTNHNSSSITKDPWKKNAIAAKVSIKTPASEIQSETDGCFNDSNQDSMERLMQELCKELDCDICGYRTYDKIMFQKHTLRHNKSKKQDSIERLVKELDCDICGYKTYDKIMFQKHALRHNKKLNKM